MKSSLAFLCVVMISVATHFFVEKNQGGRFIMEDYKAMYYNLFNQLTDVIEQLKEIQAKAEEMYINANSDDEKE